MIVLVIAIIGVILAFTVFKEEDDTFDDAEEVTIEGPEVFEEGEAVLIWSNQHENNIHSVATSPDGETVAVGEYLTSYVYHLSDGSLEQVLVYEHSVEDLEYSLDGSILGGGLTVYGSFLSNPNTGEELARLHGGYNSRLAFSPNGEHIATGNRSGIIWIWDIESGDQLLSLEEEETTWVNALEFHPDGKLLAATHWGKVGQSAYINIWNIEEEEIVNRIELNVNIGTTKNIFKFSPNGDVMAHMDMDEDRVFWIYLLDVESGEEVRRFEIGRNLNDLDFSPDGTMLAIAEQTNPVRIWDVSTGELLYTFDQEGMVAGVSNWIEALSFTPDGKHVVVVRGDNSLELWRLPGGEPIQARPRDIKNPPPLPSDVMFDTNSSELKSEADPVLEEFAKELLESLPAAIITFIGHTDSRGNASSNMTLSLDRARSVKIWFENWSSQNNVTGWTFEVDGKGESDLKVPDVDSEGNFLTDAGRLNRRVEIEIEEL